MGKPPALTTPVLSTLESVLHLRRAEDLSPLCRGVKTLSELFTRRREAIPPDYLDDDALRKSYLAYFCPVNLGKVQSVLAELPDQGHPLSYRDRPYRLLDIGTGPGTAALGVVDWFLRDPSFRRIPLDVVMVDRSRLALRDAERLLKTYGGLINTPSIRLSTIHANLERKSDWLRHVPQHASGCYDLIVAANCLNELYRAHRDPCRPRTKLVTALLGLLADHGSLILIEPATRLESRALHRLRDSLLEGQACTVYSPCLHERPCPALCEEWDWCHEERWWEPPWMVTHIDRQVGLIKDALKFSYLVLRKDGKTIVPRHRNVFRVVSELRPMKGEKRAWLCNETGRIEVGRLDRLRSDSNKALEAWHRGAIISVSDITRKPSAHAARTLARIPTSSHVEVVQPVTGLLNDERWGEGDGQVKRVE